MLSLPRYRHTDISEGRDIEHNAEIFLSVLHGTGEQAREDIVCINAGSLLYVSGEVASMEEGFAKAKESVKSGKAFKKLVEFVESTKGNMECITQFLSRTSTT